MFTHSPQGRHLLVALLALSTAAGTATARTTPQRPPHPSPARHHRHRRQRDPFAVATAARRPPEPGTPAPVPDDNLTPPTAPKTPSTHVTPALMSLNYPWFGDGYVPGSSPQAMDDRNTAKAPGLEVRMPLSQAPPALPPLASPSRPAP